MNEAAGSPFTTKWNSLRAHPGYGRTTVIVVLRLLSFPERIARSGYLQPQTYPGGARTCFCQPRGRG
jgi:hypothetical protein